MDELEEMLEAYYQWTPNIFQIKSLETGYYFGNVIGNRSKEEQMAIVSDEGEAQKETILEESQALIDEINARSQKFIDIMALSDDTMDEIVLFYGGMFVLDTSPLDSTPLG